MSYEDKNDQGISWALFFLMCGASYFLYELHSDFTKLKENVDSLDADISDLSEKVKGNEDRLASLYSRIDDLDSKIDDIEAVLHL